MPISKNEIKNVRSLFLKKFRERERLFIVEGEKMVAEAKASDLEFVREYRLEDIGEENMSKITQLNTPSPVLAVVRMPEAASVKLNPGELYLALDGVRDPGNMGTIFRIADWFGIKTIFLSRDCVDIYNSKVIQSTMGAIFRIHPVITDLQPLIAEAREAGIETIGTFLDGTNMYREDLPEGGIIVMGNESEGISAELEKIISKKILIPPYPADTRSSESLNVAIATSIICAEFRRRAGK